MEIGEWGLEIGEWRMDPIPKREVENGPNPQTRSGEWTQSPNEEWRMDPIPKREVENGDWGVENGPNPQTRSGEWRLGSGEWTQSPNSNLQIIFCCFLLRQPKTFILPFYLKLNLNLQIKY